MAWITTKANFYHKKYILWHERYHILILKQKKPRITKTLSFLTLKIVYLKQNTQPKGYLKR